MKWKKKKRKLKWTSPHTAVICGVYVVFLGLTNEHGHLWSTNQSFDWFDSKMYGSSRFVFAYQISPQLLVDQWQDSRWWCESFWCTRLHSAWIRIDSRRHKSGYLSEKSIPGYQGLCLNVSRPSCSLSLPCLFVFLPSLLQLLHFSLTTFPVLPLTYLDFISAGRTDDDRVYSNDCNWYRHRLQSFSSTFYSPNL